MKITDEHLYHGAALTQIAEHKAFTAINGIRINGELHRSAFRVNDDIGVYFKYATKPTPAHREYLFTFTPTHLADLASLKQTHSRLFIGLVCVKDSEICCIPYSLLLQMLVERRSRVAGDEVSTVLVTAPKGKKLRVYMNSPGTKGKSLTQHLVARSAFPDELFVD